MQLLFWLCVPLFRRRRVALRVGQQLPPREHSSRPAPVPPPARRRPLYPSVDDVQRMHGITWTQLVDREPEVESLLWQARSAGARCQTVVDVNRAFVPLRNELAGLLGFTGKHRRHSVLGCIGAYEVAYWKLYDALAGQLSSRPAA
jgi:hypothetical protein